MERIYVTYNLKPETSEERYIEFSKEKDQVVVPHVRGIMKFDIFWVVSGLHGPDSEPLTDLPMQVIESVDVASWDSFLKALQTDELRELGAEHAEIADVSSLRILRTRQI